MKKIIFGLISMITVISLLSGCAGNSKPVTEAPGNEIVENQDNASGTNDTASDDMEIIPENTDNKKEDTNKTEVTNKPSTDNNKPSVDNKPSDVSGTKPQTPSVSEISLSELMNGMISVIPSDQHNLEALPAEFYKDLYGVDKSQFEDAIIYGTMINVKANEIIIIKVKNESDISKAKSVLEARKSQVYKTWEQYLPEQFEMVKQAQIKSKGKYVALIIAPEVSKVAAKFDSLIK